MAKPKRTAPYKAKSTAKYANDPSEPRRCHAACRNGKRCKRSTERGCAVCYLHGARGGRPIVHGAYSFTLEKFRQAHEAAMEDEERLYSLVETLALLDVAVRRAIVRVEDKDTPAMRRRCLGLVEKLMGGPTPGEVAQLMGALQTTISEGVEEDEAFDFLARSVERLATHKEKAWDVRLKAAHAINSRDLVVLFAKVIQICTEEAGLDHAKIIAQRVSAEVMGEGS